MSISDETGRLRFLGDSQDAKYTSIEGFGSPRVLDNVGVFRLELVLPNWSLRHSYSNTIQYFCSALPNHHWGCDVDRIGIGATLHNI